MARNKKIIVLYSTAGMGHKKAADAIYQKLITHGDEVDVELVDIMEYASGLYRKIYLDFYVYLMSDGKNLWKFLYYFSNNTIVDMMTRKVRGMLDYANLSALGDLLAEKSPDGIIATHFLLSSIAETLKKKKKLTCSMYTVLTDYGPHAVWLSDHIDRFFVGTEKTSTELALMGTAPSKIEVTGIPTTEEFGRVYDRPALSAKYGVNEGKKTLLLMSGGFGVGPLGDILLSLKDNKDDIQVITVCGHNKSIFEKLQRMENDLGFKHVLLGFTDKVAELMAISDVMITKAGGISVTESMNMRLPMILFGSVPGQETWNEEVLMNNGAAEKAEKIEDIPVVLKRLILDGNLCEAIKKGIDKIRRPEATGKIVDIVLDDIMG